MRLVLSLAVAITLAACGGSAGSASSGIRGEARVGICAVEQVGMECTAPFEGAFQVRRGGEVVRTVGTRSDGRFEADLPPGRYVLVSEDTLPYLKPTVVVVRADGFTPVSLRFDSGIR